jgi:hypothetical protein
VPEGLLKNLRLLPPLSREQACCAPPEKHIGYSLKKARPGYVISTGVMRGIAKWRNLVSNGRDHAIANQIPRLRSE